MPPIFEGFWSGYLHCNAGDRAVRILLFGHDPIPGIIVVGRPKTAPMASGNVSPLSRQDQGGDVVLEPKHWINSEKVELPTGLDGHLDAEKVLKGTVRGLTDCATFDAEWIDDEHTLRSIEARPVDAMARLAQMVTPPQAVASAAPTREQWLSLLLAAGVAAAIMDGGYTGSDSSNAGSSYSRDHRRSLSSLGQSDTDQDEGTLSAPPIHPNYGDVHSMTGPQE